MLAAVGDAAGVGQRLMWFEFEVREMSRSPAITATKLASTNPSAVVAGDVSEDYARAV